MSVMHKTKRHHAVTMQLAADLEGRYVEMRIVTDTGETIAVACPRDSIFAIQQHIEQIGRECPEIATWGQRRRPQPMISGGTSPTTPFKQQRDLAACAYAAVARRAPVSLDMTREEAAQKRA